MNAKRLPIAIFAECSEQIGTGHLIESLYLLKEALARNFKVSIWVSRTTPNSILERLSCAYNFFHSLDSQDEIKKIKRNLILNGCKVILFNFRKIKNETLSVFKYKARKLICIDEFGQRRLDCDAIINPTIIKRYHSYFLDDDKAKVYAGPKYLPMSPAFKEARRKKRIFNKEIKTISVSMGGVDKPGITVRLIDILAKWKPQTIKNIILGGGFAYLEEVYKRTELLKGKNFRIWHNIPNIESLFLESDVVFTTGGDTLYELACVGTPAVVLYEEEHENENGLAFEKYGFGFCIGQGTEVNEKDILNALKKFEDVNVRRIHSFNGKEIVDCKGNYRILKIIESLIEDDKTVTALS